MLGTSIEKCKIKNGDWFSVSEKLNGCRIIFYKGDFYTRQGKKYSGLDHIRRELQCILIGTNMVVDCELIYKNPEGLTNSEAFQVGTGIANSDAKEKQELKLVILIFYKCLILRMEKSNLTYKERKAELESLREAIENLALENISIVDMFYEGTDKSEIMKWLDYAEENDMEGCMVNLDALYECKRTKSLIKVKKFYNFDLEIIGYEEGDGRLKGALGALIVDFNGNSVSVGSGFSDEDRRFFWSNKNECIGRVIEIKYKEITRDKKQVSKSLQFPVFVSLAPTGKEVELELKVYISIHIAQITMMNIFVIEEVMSVFIESGIVKKDVRSMGNYEYERMLSRYDSECGDCIVIKQAGV